MSEMCVGPKRDPSGTQAGPKRDPSGIKKLTTYTKIILKKTMKIHVERPVLHSMYPGYILCFSEFPELSEFTKCNNFVKSDKKIVTRCVK